MRAVVTGLLSGVVLALVFAAGFFTRDALSVRGLLTGAASAQGQDYALLDEVQALVDDHFVRPQPDYQVRQYGAVRGMLGTLNDPFTFFIDPPVAQSESDVLAGTYGGVGVQIRRTENGELLLYPFADSSAAAAGIEDGDRLIAVNEMTVDTSMQADVLDQMLRGEVRDGNGVTLTVLRAADGAEFSAFVPFAPVNVPSLVWRMLPEDARLGYMQIMRFTNRTPDELEQALTELRASGAQALVLDMRNNAGGLLTESIEVADAFLDSGVIVYQRTPRGEQTFESSPGGPGSDLPLVILVNGGTASGAELVAGALVDNDRAIMIGQRTYGKGTVQQIFPLSDGSSLHVTSSEWFTPARQPLDQAGLTPDIDMIPNAEGRDVELGEAIRQLDTLLNGTGS
ncbi:MAG: S41 family peptidase [Pleurocapsa minor GSE-CHR-MK-17-07R]|nr:S41 family peptidase [Pleurocapsa minor GSE-CHR-MK 17-07R]